MARQSQRVMHGALVLEGYIATAARCIDLPALRAQAAGDEAGRISKAEDQEMRHPSNLAIGCGLQST